MINSNRIIFLFPGQAFVGKLLKNVRKNLLVVLKNKIAKKTKTTLVKSNQRGHVWAAELFRGPEYSAITTERHNEIYSGSELIGHLADGLN